MAGYSKRTLAEKLGIRAGMYIALLNEPAGYEKSIGILPENVNIDIDLQKGKQYDFIQYFTTSRSDLISYFSPLISHLKPTGMIWISWPKKASKVTTDIDEQVLRDVGLPLGVVDVKVCAVDEVWSGLKFVRRRRE